MWMMGLAFLKEASCENIRSKTFSNSYRNGIAKGYVAGLFRCHRKRYVSPEA